jgi:hypothetical protein
MKCASSRAFSIEEISSKWRISESRFIGADHQRSAAQWQAPNGGRLVRADERQGGVT